MSTDPRLAELSGLEVFAGCTQRQLEAIAGLADHVSFPAGAALTCEGRTGRECFVLIEGRVSVTIRGRRLATLRHGDMVGEMALIEQEPRAATVTALEPTQALVFSTQGFTSLLDLAPGVVVRVMQTLSRRLREIQSEAA